MKFVRLYGINNVGYVIGWSPLTRQSFLTDVVSMTIGCTSTSALPPGPRLFTSLRLGLTGALMGLATTLVSCSATRSPLATQPATQPSDREIRLTESFDAPALETQFRRLARQVSPAVVAIAACDARIEADGVQRSEEINPDKLAHVLEPVDRTVGTGFIVDSDGYVVTNEHVVGKAEQIWVITDDRKVYPAIIIGSDPRADLAVLKIPARGLPTVRFASADVKRGQWAISIGNPYGMASRGEMAISIGVVSATGRSLPKLAGKEDRLYSDLIQTTAQINPGNSGGPLFDVKGDVIGINCAVILPQKQTNGIGFALPADERVRQIIQSLKNGREVTYGYLGVRVSTPTLRECRECGLNAEVGAKIDGVDADSPAESAGLKRDDIVLRLDGREVHDGDSFVRMVGACSPGNIPAVVYREGKPRTINLPLRRREAATASITRESQRIRWKGLLLGPIPANWTAAGKQIAQGLMVLAIDPRSPLLKEGITQGSIITTVAGRAVADVKGLQQILNDMPDDRCAVGFSVASPTVATARD